MASGREMGEAYRYPNLEFYTYHGFSLLSLFQTILTLSHTVIIESH